MDSKELSKIIKDNGIVGAGGAGFPTYMKIDERAQTILLNCAECEPLLKLHRQLLQRHAEEILETFQLVADTVGAERAIVGIKEEYKDTVAALKECIHKFPKVSLHLLDSVYPCLLYTSRQQTFRPYPFQEHRQHHQICQSDRYGYSG